MGLTAEQLERCSALLLIPAIADRLVAEAHERRAGAVILDLEDSIPPESKSLALDRIPAAVTRLRSHGMQVLVRINPGSVADVEAVVGSGAQAVILPKVERASEVEDLDALITMRERALGVPSGETRIVIEVETPLAVLNASVIAGRSDRAIGLVLDSRDLARALAVDLSSESLAHAAAHLVIVARAAGVTPLWLPGPLQELAPRDFESIVGQGRRMGMAGAVCIQPAQVEIVNRVYRDAARVPPAGT